MPIKHELLFKNNTLTLSFGPPKTGDHGYWIHDKTRGMNLAMKAETEQEAWIDVVEYYQERLQDVERDYKSLKSKVDVFVDQFIIDSNEE